MRKLVLNVMFIANTTDGAMENEINEAVNNNISNIDDNKTISPIYIIISISIAIAILYIASYGIKRNKENIEKKQKENIEKKQKETIEKEHLKTIYAPFKGLLTPLKVFEKLRNEILKKFEIYSSREELTDGETQEIMTIIQENMKNKSDQESESDQESALQQLQKGVAEVLEKIKELSQETGKDYFSIFFTEETINNDDNNTERKTFFDDLKKKQDELYVLNEMIIKEDSKQEENIYWENILYIDEYKHCVVEKCVCIKTASDRVIPIGKKFVIEGEDDLYLNQNDIKDIFDLKQAGNVVDNIRRDFFSTLTTYQHDFFANLQEFCQEYKKMIYKTENDEKQREMGEQSLLLGKKASTSAKQREMGEQSLLLGKKASTSAIMIIMADKILEIILKDIEKLNSEENI